MPDGVRIDASDLKKVGRIAKAFSPQLNRQLNKQLRAAGRIGANVVKADILAMPSNGKDVKRHEVVDERGSGAFSLRELIAQAVTVTATTVNLPDVRIRVRRTPALQQIGAAGIAKAIDSGQWRHPLFGNRDYWYEQKGWEFFDKPLAAMRPEILVMVQKALDDAIAIAKGNL